MHTFERAQESAHIGPHAFSGVNMHFPVTVTVPVPRPLPQPMMHGFMRPFQPLIPSPFVTIDPSSRASETIYMRLQRGVVRVMNYPQVHLTASTAHHT